METERPPLGRVTVHTPDILDSSYRAIPNSDIQQKYLNRVADLQADLDDKTNENTRLRYDFQFLKSEFAHSKDEFARKLAEQQAQYKTSLESIATDRQALLVGKDVAIQKHSNEITKLSKENQFHIQRISDLQEEVATLVRDKNQILEDFQATQRHHKQTDTLRSDEQRKADMANQSLTSQNQTLISDLEKTRASLIIANEKSSLQTRRADDLEGQLSKLRNDLVNTTRDLEKNIARERSRREELEAMYKNKTSALESLVEASNSQRDEQRRISSEIESKASKNQEAMRSAFQLQINQLNMEKESFEETISRQKATIRDLEDKIMDSNRQFENQTNELTNSIAKHVGELERSENIIKDLRNKVDQVASVEAQLHSKNLQLEEIHALYDKAKADFQKREAQLLKERQEADEHRIEAI